MASETIVERDCRAIWHPFMKKNHAPIPFVSGKGTKLFTPEGEAFLDGISSWWVNLHGHAHPYIAEKIALQATKLEHVIFTHFTHEPAVHYAERLLAALPQGYSRVFYSDNGSTAVETALKMAIQYWKNKGSSRKKILSFKKGYHGDTFGAMSSAGPNAFNIPFRSFLFDVISIDPPWPGQEKKSLQQLQEALSDDVICFIYEPLLQGAFGMNIYSPYALEPLLALIKSSGALLIADEVLTGFGRLGPLFSSSLMSTKPDIIALSKGITGGFLPLGATVTTEEIYAAFDENPFLHGHSYTANPIACAAALASLDLAKSSSNAREHIHSCHQSFLKKWAQHPSLKRLEVIGTILVLEYHTPPPPTFFHSRHIILRPLGNVYYVMPPYCITDEELNTIYLALEESWNT